jgi:hypothetical protein
MLDPLIIKEHVYFTSNPKGFMDNFIMNRNSSFDNISIEKKLIYIYLCNTKLVILIIKKSMKWIVKKKKKL